MGNATHDQCHVRIEFDEPRLTLDYRAEREAAITYADEVIACLGAATITIDDEVHDGLEPLPCARLWT